ncbi:MAG: caspase family protein [Planctomycetota bacterium]
MQSKLLYAPSYANSWALVIGVNTYARCGQLDYACNDAEAIAAVLKTRFGFPDDRVTLLLDSSASQDNIRAAFLRFTNSDVLLDDRIVVFFAGHGFTARGRRGEVGFLVPVNGDPNELSSLIPWHDLTRNAELIPAKHVLFFMDACYGGRAITRALAPGSKRFLKEMLQRPARQVLTAGKADEVVADAGGPRSGHSMFTGHLLDALEGAAAAADGIISANAVMAYVYDRVSKDPPRDSLRTTGFWTAMATSSFMRRRRLTQLSPCRRLMKTC